MTLTYKEVSEILKIIDTSNCEEVILELENTRLVVRRGTSSVSNKQNQDIIPPSQTTEASTKIPITKSSNSLNTETSGTEEYGGSIIRSPMVGTFYKSPSPEEPPFVKEGTIVAIGTPLCLIEVMKLYTTVESTVSGTINSVLVKDGTLVQFDQPLFTISEN